MANPIDPKMPSNNLNPGNLTYSYNPSSPNPGDYSKLKAKEISNVVLYHKQAISNSRDLKLTPKDIKIASLDADEKIFIYLRRHWSENITWIIRNIFYSLMPLLLIPFLSILKIEDLNFVSFKEVFIIVISYYAVIVTNIVKDFFDWYFDPYIITNERIIHYEFKPFAKYSVQETMLGSIQKIEEKAGGILSNLFGYGTLIVTIEGPNESFVFKNIPQPTKVRNMISDLTKVSKKYGSI